VKLVDIDGAIEAVQDSANGKNKVTYSSHAPTENDRVIFDDTWFVGQVGRPNDVIEATNLALNPSFEKGIEGWGTSSTSTTLVSETTYADRMGGTQGARNARLTAEPNINPPYASAQIGNAEKISAEIGRAHV